MQVTEFKDTIVYRRAPKKKKERRLGCARVNRFLWGRY